MGFPFHIHLKAKSMVWMDKGRTQEPTKEKSIKRGGKEGEQERENRGKSGKSWMRKV